MVEPGRQTGHCDVKIHDFCIVQFKHKHTSALHKKYEFDCPEKLLWTAS